MTRNDVAPPDGVDLPDLPEGWQWVYLQELLARIEAGKNFRCEERPPIPSEYGVVKVSAVTWGTYDESESKTIVDLNRVNLEYLIKPGDFLFSRANTIGLIGACLIVHDTQRKLLLSDKILRFEFAANVKNWINWLLKSRLGRMQIEALSTGNQESMRNIGQEQIGRICVPLPPADEQRRIVAKLEELFSELDHGMAALTTAADQLDKLRLLILHRAVCTKDGAFHPTRALDELIGPIGQGWSPKCELNRIPDEGEWAIIRTTAVQPMAYWPKECKPLSSELKPRVGIELQDGDLLMTRKGPRPRTGVVCYVRKARPRSMLCDTVYRFRALEEIVSAEYLEIALNAPSVMQAINARKSGINESGISLNHARLRSLPIPVPQKKATQASVVQTVHERLSLIEGVSAGIAEQKQKLHALRQAILKKAFSGELVAQDPRDEPASVLLECVRAEREGSTTKKERTNGKRKAA